MAKTRDYLDYLDEKIEISPANSQEEYQAAQTIAEVMKDHGLETSIEEFGSYSMSGVMPAILMLVMFVTLLVAGLTTEMLHIVMLLLSIASVGILLLSHFLFDVFENFGPTQQSQNVVGLHRAEGDKVTKGSRPIVIVAHYDSPRESVLRNGPLARYEAAIRRSYVPCSCAIAFSLFIQLLGFLPEIIRIAFWVIGLIASIPMLLLAIVTIIDRHSSCSLGANDNKSSVAAMLSILSKVRPGEDRVTNANLARSSRRGDQPGVSTPRRVEVVEEVKGVRHGAQVMNALGILPASCELVYEEPKVRMVEEEPEPVQDEVVEAAEEEIASAPAVALATGAAAKSVAYDEDEEPYDEDEEEYEEDYDEDDEYDDEDGWIDDEYDVGEETEPEPEPEEEPESEPESDSKAELAPVALEEEEEEEVEVADEDEEDYDEEDEDFEDDEDDYDESDEDYEDYEDEEYDEEYEDYADEEDYEDEEYEDEDADYDDEDEEDGDYDEDEDEGESVGFFRRIANWFIGIFAAIRNFFANLFSRKNEEDVDFEIERGEDRTDGEDEDYDAEDYDDDSDDEYDDEYDDEDYEDEEYDEEEVDEDEAASDDSDDDEANQADVLTYEPKRRGSPSAHELPSWDDEEMDEGPQFVVVDDDVAEEADDEVVPESTQPTYGDPRDFEYDEDEEPYEDDSYDAFDFYDDEEEDIYESNEEDVVEEQVDSPEVEDEVPVHKNLPQQAPIAEDAEQAYADADPTMVGMSITDRIKTLFGGRGNKGDAKPVEEEQEFEDVEDQPEVQANDQFEDEPIYEEQYEDYYDDGFEDEEESFFEGSIDDVEDDYYYESTAAPEPEPAPETAPAPAPAPEPAVAPAAEAAVDDDLEDNPYFSDDLYDDDDEFDDDDLYDDDFDDAYEGRYEEQEAGVEQDYDAYEDGAAVEEEEDGEVLVQRPEDPNRLHFDREEDDDIVPRDTSGLDTISDSYDLYNDDRIGVPPDYEKPEPIDDPSWGVPTYQPARPSMNIARRAALFDLPDPSAAFVDPLADEYEDDYEDEIETQDNQRFNASTTQQNTDPSDVNPSDWKGGATMRSDLREADGEEPIVIDADDLQDAILEMGDDFLVAHDIWFVATGASKAGHAGIKAFLKEHKRDIRGAFLVNLECVGAGDLTVLTLEGLHAPRRADRRLVRLLTGVAKDLHINLGTASYDWDETESASAMRSRVRSVTITGLDENGMQAYSGTDDDVPENVDPKQVSSVVRLVTEMIRRS